MFTRPGEFRVVRAMEIWLFHKLSIVLARALVALTAKITVANIFPFKVKIPTQWIGFFVYAAINIYFYFIISDIYSY